MAQSLPGPSHPQFMRFWEVGATLFFFIQPQAPSPRGVGRPGGWTVGSEAWATEPGISFQTHTVSLLCCFPPVPTPHLCQSPGILLWSGQRPWAETLLRASLPPPSGCPARPLHDLMCLASGPRPSHRRDRRKRAQCYLRVWCLSLESAWALSFFTLQNCGILIHANSHECLQQRVGPRARCWGHDSEKNSS